MAIKFFKCRFKKDNYLQMNSINEFNIFKDIITFSKKEVYKEMKLILKNIDNKIDKQMAEAIEKYHIVMELKNQISDIEKTLSEYEEEININMNGTKEANIIARYSENMLNNLLKEGFNSDDKDLEKKAMTVTYSKRIMLKLDNIVKKDLVQNTNNEENEFKDIEENQEIHFEKSEKILENNTFESNLNQEIKLSKLSSVNSCREKNNTTVNKDNTYDKGGTEMFDEEYSKEAYDLFVKGSDEEIVDEVEKVGEEAYDILVKETEDDVLRKNEDDEVVSKKAYEEYIKNNRKIKEVEDDESYNK
ncbi:hypothetical protein [Peptacetobacter sp.]|uniref:hypothetical protein n=1 Tax=Peptacetobacter sp. TaxID=2991975 RepID=UPI002635D71D|nr:hypothetical protein [Peptacetobacter sp.]